jgi:hypothetical protein
MSAGQMGLEFSANPCCLEEFKKRNGIILKNTGRVSQELSQEMMSGWLE